MSMKLFVRTLNALLMFIVMGVITAAFYQQYFKKELPCPLCLLQRLGMTGVAIGAMMNLQFGLKVKHYMLSLLAAIMGGVFAARQILLHICPGSSIFGYPVFGLSLYTWSFLVFAGSIFAIVVMLFLYHPENREPLPYNWFEILAVIYLMAVTLTNLILTLFECGLGPCQDIPWPQPAP